jgi:hypothetical protein
MGAAASLHRDYALFQMGDQLEYIFSADAPPHDDPPRAVEARQATYFLTQVDPNNRDLHLAPSLSSCCTGSLCYRMEGRAIP